MTGAAPYARKARYVRLTTVISISLGFVAMWALPPDLNFRWDRLLSGTPQPYFGFSAERFLEGVEPWSGWAIAGFLTTKFAIGVAAVWLVYFVIRYVISGSSAVAPSSKHWSNYIRQAIAALVILAAGVYCFHLIDEYRLFRRQTREFSKVRLAESRAEVLYKLGQPQEVHEEPKPIEDDPYTSIGKFSRVFYVDGPEGDLNTIPKGKTLNDFSTWAWSTNKAGESYVAVTFDHTGSVESILCFDKRSGLSAWGPLAGIRDDAYEESILELGNPTRTKIDGVTKTIEFDDIGVRFNLSKQRVYSAELRHSTGGEIALLKRFLHTMLP